MDHDLSIDLVLQSFFQSYSQFVLNLNVNKLEAAFLELTNMLINAKPNIKKDMAKEKCHFCSKKGRWKHNYRAYLVGLKEKKHMDALTLGI